MSDDTAARALRSDAPLVVIEAPAGCGETFQGAEYVSEAAAHQPKSRVLVLTHTHAACDVFAKRTQRARNIEIRTIDSLISQIAGVYHTGLDFRKILPLGRVKLEATVTARLRPNRRNC